MAEVSRLFEISWEVCNKVGGIHTVITSKLPQALRSFPDRYCAVGPYLPGNPSPEFSEQPLPDFLKGVSEQLAQKGVQLHYGTWLVPGEPPVILLDWTGLVEWRDAIKARYWEKYQLDTLGSDFYDLDQPLLWSTAVGMLIEECSVSSDNPIIAHGHEWLSAGLFLHLGLEERPKVRTVFTTHATVLGRSLLSHDIFIYDKLDKIKPDEDAKTYGVTSKHQLEKLSATHATVFTTVSQVTAEEAFCFLGRAPEVVTENGLAVHEFPAFDRLCIARTETREKLDDFVSAYFFPSYRFDLTKVSYQFTMGRYESHNKGYDIYLDSLARLNAKMKEEKSDKIVVSFLLVATGSLGVRPEITTQLMIYRRVVNLLSQLAAATQRDVYRELWDSDPKQPHALIDPELHETIRHLLTRLPHQESPAISPFVMYNGDQDEISKLATKYGLGNTKEDKVKVVFMPVYLDGFDGIFNIPLYDLLSGFDLGVFPSLYEPWGYTPMESLVMGVPAVTSNLAGFGQSLPNRVPRTQAALVLDRSSGDTEKAASDLATYLWESLAESPREWLLRRMDAYTTIQAFSWNKLYEAYTHTYALATEGM
ncbi:MAG: glycogen/starch synthase [bacterium]